MTPLFSPDCVLVGWVEENRYIFNTDLNWVAFIANGHAWSAASCHWLGAVNGGCMLDTLGKVVVFSEGSPVSGTLKPLKPLRPLKPLKPLKPLRPLQPLKPLKPLKPLSGWSALTWLAWLNQ